MKSITQIQHELDGQTLISNFFRLIGLGKICKAVNFNRSSSVSLASIIAWLFEARFNRYSMYRVKESVNFTSRTARNVMNDGRINWQKLLCLASSKIMSALAPFIDKRRRLAFVIDDTLISRPFSSKTELLSKIFDHNKKQYLKGYRNLTLGWTDGNTFLPVNFALMSTSNSKNLVGSAPSTTDRRSIAGKRRIQAQQKMSDVAVQLIKQAVSLGVKAQYVLFDSWYSSPKMFWNLRQLNLDGIGMLKKSQKTYFKYRGRQYSVKALYERIKHSRVKIKDDYLFSCMVQAQYEGYQFELKLVFVSKKGRDDDYLILATTQTKLQPQTIIQLYGRRWQIESYFKASKQYLAMDELQIQSYDGQVSYIAITELAYILLAWQERLNTDDKTLGDLFYSFTNSLPDITFICALVYLISVLKCSSNEFIENKINQFMHTIPSNVQNIISRVL